MHRSNRQTREAKATARRRAMILSATLLVTPALAASGPASKEPAMQTKNDQSVLDAIKANNARFADALMGKSRAQLANIFTTDVVLLPPGKPAISGRDAVLDFWQASFGPDGTQIKSLLEPSEVEVAGDFAFEMGKATVSAIQGGQERVLDRGKYVVVWKREGDTWRMHRDIFNSDGPPQG